jgi:hypothetical protein
LLSYSTKNAFNALVGLLSAPQANDIPYQYNRLAQIFSGKAGIHFKVHLIFT